MSGRVVYRFRINDQERDDMAPATATRRKTTKAQAKPVKPRVAGTEFDGRLVANRELNKRQKQVLRRLAKKPMKPSELAKSAIFKNESFAPDKARRSLMQLVGRGYVSANADGSYAITKQGTAVIEG
jgi:hypothetical protein